MINVEAHGSIDGIESAQGIRSRLLPIGIIVTSGQQRPDPEDLPEDAAVPAEWCKPKTVIETLPATSHSP